MSEENKNLNTDNSSGGQPSLESILSEYKTNAFISGEKKLSADKLSTEADRVVAEVRVLLESGTIPDEQSVEVNPDREGADTPDSGAISEGMADRSTEAEGPPEAEKREESAPETQEQKPKPSKRRLGRQRSEKKYGKSIGYVGGEEDEDGKIINLYSYDDINEDEQDFFGIGKYARITAPQDEVENAEATVEKAVEREKQSMSLRRLLERFKEPQRAETEPVPEENEEPEPSLSEAVRLNASGVGAMRVRAILATLIAVVMCGLIFLQDAGVEFIKPLTENRYIWCGIMLCTELIVVFLGLPVVSAGFAALFRLKPNGESLIVISCTFTGLDTAIAMLIKDTVGAPFAAVSALSVAFALWGTYWSRRAYQQTYRTAAMAGEPYSVTAEGDRVAEGTLLMKNRGESRGFVALCLKESPVVTVFSKVAPLLLIAAAVFAAIAAFYGGIVYYFLRFLAMITAVAAPLSIFAAFGLPYLKLSKRLSAAGSAIAGWSGACNAGACCGINITDDDLFPKGAVAMNGMRVLGGVSVDKVVAYTGSMVCAAGLELSDIFKELMKGQGCAFAPIDDFACYEGGGIGASIYGEEVLVGSAGFMNLMGIRLPPKTGVKNAVFTAISREIVGIFAINYTGVNSVRAAISTLMRSRVLPVFAVRDFNIMPVLLNEKFTIPVDDIEFLTFEERYRLSRAGAGREKTIAVLCREGLAPFAEIILGAKQLLRSVRFATALSVSSAVIGELLMFYFCRAGAFQSVTAANTLVYMLMWLLPTFLIAGNTDRY